MKKMRGIVALCVCADHRWLHRPPCSRRKHRRQRRKSSAPRPSRLTSIRWSPSSTPSGAGRVAAPSDMAVTWDTSHFFRAPDGSTYMPFTVDRRQEQDHDADRGAVRPRCQQRRRPRPRRRKARRRTRRPISSLGEVRLRHGRCRRQGRPIHPGEARRLRFVRRGQGQGNRRKGGQELHAQSRRSQEGPHGSGLQQARSSRRAACSSRRRFSRPPVGSTADDDPYVFGQMQIVPSKDGKYKKTDTLSVVYWVYGATGDAAGKPDLTVENSFNQKTADGEKFFNKTAASGAQRARVRTTSSARGPELPRGAARQFRSRRLPAGNQDYGQAIGQDRHAERQFHGAGDLKA